MLNPNFQSDGNPRKDAEQSLVVAAVLALSSSKWDCNSCN